MHLPQKLDFLTRSRAPPLSSNTLGKLLQGPANGSQVTAWPWKTAGTRLNRLVYRWVDCKSLGTMDALSLAGLETNEKSRERTPFERSGGNTGI